MSETKKKMQYIHHIFHHLNFKPIHGQVLIGQSPNRIVIIKC